MTIDRQDNQYTVNSIAIARICDRVNPQHRYAAVLLAKVRGRDRGLRPICRVVGREIYLLVCLHLIIVSVYWLLVPLANNQ